MASVTEHCIRRCVRRCRRRATWRYPPNAMWALRLRPALRGPHAAARCSVRRRLQGRRCTAFGGASDAAGAVRRGGLRLLQCGRYACAQRCEDRTPRHAVAYAAVYKAGAALRSAVRLTLRRRATWRSPPPAMWALRLCPALRGPHAEARCSVRRRLQGRRCTAFGGASDAAGAVRRGDLRLLQCGATLAYGAARTARRGTL
jgi:hypothetical protein